VSRRPPQDGAMQSFYASSWATTAGGGSASSSRRSSRELQPLHSNSGVSQPVAAASAAAQQPALQKAGHRQPEFFFIGDDTEDDPSISDADMPEAVSTEKENPEQCGSTVVYFHNVPFGIEEASLLPLFQTVGQLKSLRVFRQRNDRATGQGLCEFTSHDAAVRALRILHGNPIEDVSGTGARALQLRLHDESRTPAGGLDEKGREEERPRRAKPGGFRLRAGGGKLRSKPAEPGVEKQAQHGRQNPTIDQLDQLRLAWQRVEGDLADVSGGRQMLGGEKKHTGTVSSFSYAKLRFQNFPTQELEAPVALVAAAAVATSTRAAAAASAAPSFQASVAAPASDGGGYSSGDLGSGPVSPCRLRASAIGAEWHQVKAADSEGGQPQPPSTAVDGSSSLHRGSNPPRRRWQK